jgi:hypothetical protein
VRVHSLPSRETMRLTLYLHAHVLFSPQPREADALCNQGRPVAVEGHHTQVSRATKRARSLSDKFVEYLVYLSRAELTSRNASRVLFIIIYCLSVTLWILNASSLKITAKHPRWRGREKERDPLVAAGKSLRQIQKENTPTCHRQ